MAKQKKLQQNADIFTTLSLFRLPQVSPIEFYRSVFPEGALAQAGTQEQGKYNAVIYADGEKPLYVHDDLEAIQICTDIFGDDPGYVLGRPIMNCIAYAGNCNREELARQLYAFAFYVVLHPDIHYWNVDGGIYLRHTRGRFSPPKICPTFIVTDETEAFFYYVLETPLPLYPKLIRKIQNLYNMISREIHHAVDELDRYPKPMPASIFERYPVVGSESNGNCWLAYCTGDKYSLDELNQIVPKNSRLKITPPTHSIDYCKEHWPHWYDRRIVQHREPSGNPFWVNKFALYEWFLQLVEDNIDIVKLGVLEALASYSLKCNVGCRRLYSDLEELGDLLKTIFSTEEVVDHDKKARLLSKECPSELKKWSIRKIESMTGLSIPRNKRNGRTQKEHLEMLHERQSKEIEVQEWRKRNPQGTKAECAAALDICRTTVYKHWEPKRTQSKHPKPKQAPKKMLCKGCGAEMEKRKAGPWFWALKGDFYTRIDKVCPCCGLYVKGRARIVH